MPEVTVYEIRVQGALDAKWKDFFAPFSLTFGVDATILSGVVHDQAELFGILLKIRDLGLRLVSVNSFLRQEKKQAPNMNLPNSMSLIGIL
jgi:phosphopantothenoylcysteine synthetase/decarboxylase